MKLKKNLFVMSLCSLFMLCTSCDTAMAVLAGMAEGMNGYYGGSTMTSGYVPTYTSSYSEDLLPHPLLRLRHQVLAEDVEGLGCARPVKVREKYTIGDHQV